MSLRWEMQRGADAEYAYSGDAIIAMVVHQSVGDRMWAYKIDGIDAKWLGKTHGRVKSKASAKRAVNKVWWAWLQHAALTPSITTQHLPGENNAGSR